MTTKRWFYVSAGLLVVLSISAGLNLGLYRFAEAQYRALHRVRLDPTSARHFRSANAALPAPDPGDARIVFFGDSRIADWEPLPSVPGAQLVNRGRGGETTEQLLLRLERDVVALSPDVVVLQAGVNDLVAIGPLPQRAREIVERCHSNLEQIVARLEAADIRVVVMTILPAGAVPLQRRPVWSDQTRDAIELINDRLRSTDRAGTGSVVVDCDAAVGGGRRMMPDYELDTLHLNALGYETLEALIEPILAGLVQSGDGPG